jgi:electron transfer flavoprotein beta subunit
MKIAVCIKQVPTREWHPRLNDDKTWIRDQDASFEMNEPDAYALEEALRPEGEAQRRGRGLLGRPGARRAGHS